MPSLAQDLRELRDLDEPVVPVAGFERVDPDRHRGIIRLDDNEAVIKIFLDKFFLSGNRADQERRLIAVQVERNEPAAFLDVLFLKGLQKE